MYTDPRLLFDILCPFESAAPACVILRGIPGSGKSTLAAKFLEFFAAYNRVQTEPQIVSADRFFERGGKYHFNGDQLPEAHRQCRLEFYDAIDHCADLVIVDNTSIRPDEIATYYNYALDRDYQPVVVTVLCPPKIASERQIHSVPSVTQRLMFDALSRHSLPPWWRQEEYSARQP